MTEPTGSRFLRGIGIRNRLALAFSVFIALLALMAAAGAWRLDSLGSVTNKIATVDTRVERLVGDWYADTKLNAALALVITHSDDAALQRMLAPQFEAGTRRIAEQTKQVEGLLYSAEAKALYAQVNARRKAYVSARDVIMDRKMTGQTDEAMKLVASSMVPAIAAYEDAIGALVSYYERDVRASAAAATQSAVTGRNVFVALCAAGVLLGVVLSWLITASITGPIGEAVLAARSVADGDLSIDLSRGGKDETGQLLNALADMSHKLRNLVGEVAGGANTVSDTSAQIAQGNLDLSQRTEEQASTLEETASSLEELTSTVTQNAENARKAAHLAIGASEVARRGGEVVGKVVDTMTQISGASRKIADIIGVIDGIAFQTNILALNAAVEAARAGEQGRGFAVVAAEVRSLAQRSAAASKEIKTLISDSASKVDAGTRLVDAAGKTMEEVVVSVEQVTELIAEIAAASQEQSSGIGHVNAAVAQMDQVVQQNASLVEEASAATESMKEQAGSLLRMVARFRLGDAMPRSVAPMPAPVARTSAHGAPIEVRRHPVARAQALPFPAAPAHAAPNGEWKEF